MSAIAAPAHPLQSVAGATDVMADYYIKDLRAIPAELFDVSPMGAARSPLAMTLEVIGVNFAVADILLGKPSLSEEEATAKFAHIKTCAEAEAALRESVEALNKAALSLAPEDLGTEVTAPWGQPMPKARLYAAMSYHLSYHDGQLNYFQCLHNDCNYHWHD